MNYLGSNYSFNKYLFGVFYLLDGFNIGVGKSWKLSDEVYVRECSV